MRGPTCNPAEYEYHPAEGDKHRLRRDFAAVYPFVAGGVLRGSEQLTRKSNLTSWYPLPVQRTAQVEFNPRQRPMEERSGKEESHRHYPDRCLDRPDPHFDRHWPGHPRFPAADPRPVVCIWGADRAGHCVFCGFHLSSRKGILEETPIVARRHICTAPPIS